MMPFDPLPLVSAARGAWASCLKADPMCCAARTRFVGRALRYAGRYPQRVSSGSSSVLEMAIGMDRYHVQRGESEIAVSESLFAWRGGEIVLLGEQAEDRWYPVAGVEKRRPVDRCPALVVCQYGAVRDAGAAIGVGCGAGSVPGRPGGHGGGRLGRVADRRAAGRGVTLTVRRSNVLLDARSNLGLMPSRPGHEPGVRFAPLASRAAGCGDPAVGIEVTIFLHSAEWDRWALPSAPFHLILSQVWLGLRERPPPAQEATLVSSGRPR